MAKKRKSDADSFTEPEAFDVSREERRRQLANKELRQQLEAAHKTIDALDGQINTLVGLDDGRRRIEWGKPKRVTKGEAAGVLLLSDWHVEQTISAGEVNGVNEWNLTVAERSIAELFRRVVAVGLPRFRLAAKIETLVVWLGGDFIEGWFRPEQLVRNSLSPGRASLFASELIQGGLEYLAANSGCKEIIVVESVGNHGRTTEKMWASGRVDSSHEMVMYEHLRNRMRNNRKIAWHPCEGEYSYLDVFDKRLRFFHGDSVTYRDGVGGISVPVNKKIDRLDAGELKADVSFFGHFHNFLWNAPNRWVCNGCLPGAAPYSLGLGSCEPCQALAVVDRKRGLTDVAKIFAR